MNGIIIVERETFYRAGLIEVIKDLSQWEISAVCESSERAITVMSQAMPAIVVAGLWNDAMATCASRHRVILLAEALPHKIPQYGFHGILYRDTDIPGLLACLQDVTVNKPHHLERKQIPETDFAGARVRDVLTPKELKITAGVKRGMINKAIAAELGTTEQVIKNYLRSVYDKTGMSTRLELAIFVHEHPALADAVAHC